MAETTARRNRPYAPRLLPEQRREQLLDVVLDVIDAEGVGAVTVDAIARRAGVTRPVVYKNFTDANDMLRASLDREAKLALAQITEAIPAPGDEDLGNSFHHFFDTFLRAVAEAPQRWRSVFLIAPSFTPTLHKRIARIRTHIAREFEATLRESSIAGRRADHEMLANHLVAGMWESGRLLLVSPKDFPHERLLRSLDGLFTAIAAQGR
jgi:AcrR family transcriptional regulator